MLGKVIFLSVVIQLVQYMYGISKPANQGRAIQWYHLMCLYSTYSTHRGLVKRIRFAPANSPKALVLFQEGDVGIWDFSQGSPTALKTAIKGRELRTADVGWADIDHPVVATSDGCIRVLLASLAVGQSAIDVSPVGTPALLPIARALYVKVWITILCCYCCSFI